MKAELRSHEYSRYRQHEQRILNAMCEGYVILCDLQSSPP